MDDITQMLDRLSELSNEEIEALNEQILTQFDSVESQEYTPEIVETMTSLADALDAVKAEARSREAQAEELATRAAEATTRVREGAGEAEVIESEEEEEAKPEEEEEEVVEETTATASAEAEPASEFASTETEAATAVPVKDLEEEEDDAVPGDQPVDAPEETKTPEDEEEEEELDFSTTSVEAPAATETPDADSEFSADAEGQPKAEETPTPNEEPIPAQEEESPVTAAIDGAFEAPADRRPATPEIETVPVAITAGADIPGVTAGTTLSSMDEVATLMEKRLHSLRNVHGGDGEQHIVSTFSTEYPTDRLLTGNASETAAKIEKVAGPAAIIASGGFATPLEQRYDVWGLPYTTARPVRDSLPKFQADRGGIRYIVPPVLSDYEDAVGVWTQANDIAAAADGGPTKAVMTVTGAAERTAELDAITLQLQVGNLFARAYPELLARHNELALVQHSRLAERTLLAKIDAASTQVTAGKVLGVARDLLVQIRKAAAAYRSRHRIDARTNLRAIIPSWVVDAVAADLTMQMPGDDTLSTSIQEINGLLSDAGVTITESPDMGVFGAQGAGALLNFPSTFEWYLFSEGTFVFLDGGTLDLGIIRDSTLVSTNDYRMFVETFEGLAFVGVEALAITSTFAVTGEAAALADTTPTV